MAFNDCVGEGGKVTTAKLNALTTSSLQKTCSEKENQARKF